MANQLIRQGDTTGTAITRLAMSTLGLGFVATAVRTDGGKLKVQVWKVSDGSGGAGAQQIENLGHASGDAVSRVAVVTLAPDLFVTASRDGNDKLSLTAWKVAQNGNQVTPQDTVTDVAADEVAVCVARGLVVTAIRTGGGKLKLTAWKVAADGSTIERRGVATDIDIDKVAVVGTKYGVVTAVRKAGGDLGVISWSVSSDGWQVERRDDASAGAVSEVVGAYFTSLVDPGLVNERAVIATAVRDDSGGLKVIDWSVGMDTTMTIHRLSSAPGGASVSKVAIGRVGTAFETDRLVTGVRDGGGNLELRTWTTDSSQQLALEDTAPAGPADEVALAEVYQTHLVSAIRGGQGKLKLIGWKHG
ncbi:MAG TPA: hypothetical protein VF092_08130 [Longimicrobium sp.]